MVKIFLTRFLVTLTLGIFSVAGCGYNQKTLLPEHIRSIYVAPVINAIDLSMETTDKDPYRTYRPGMEIEIKNAIMNRFIFEGSLKVAKEDKAQAVLEAKLIEFRRDPLRYTDGDDVREYRLNVIIDASLIDKTTQKTIWSQTSLVGDSTYFISGASSISEDQALNKAIEDLARRVVEKTIEVW